MALGKSIKLLRTSLGYTLDDLSDRCNVDRGTISALENRDSQRSQYAAAIANKGFGLSMEVLQEIQDAVAADSIARAIQSGKIRLPASIAETIATQAPNLARLTPPPDPLLAELLTHARRLSPIGLARLVERAASLAEQYPAQANPAKSSG